MAQTPEGRVKDKIKKLLKRYGIWYYMPVQNGMGVVGIPDLICCYRGVFLAIETKAPGKVSNTTPNQDARIREINEAEGMAIVTDDPNAVETFIKAIEATHKFHPKLPVPILIRTMWGVWATIHDRGVQGIDDDDVMEIVEATCQ